MFRYQCHKSATCQLGCSKHVFTCKESSLETRLFVGKILRVSCTLVSLCWKSFDPKHALQTYIWTRLHVQPREKWFCRGSYKLKSSQETGTWITKSSPDPTESLSCEINTFRWQSWDYTSNPLITIQQWRFIAYWRNRVLWIEFVEVIITFYCVTSHMSSPWRKT